MQALSIKVIGRVQGVHFRQSTKAVADQLGVKGFIRNEADGSVYMEAEADDWIMENFLEWCNEGPDRAIVEALEKKEIEVQKFENFVIKK
jgi:acylphosphatase